MLRHTLLGTARRRRRAVVAVLAAALTLAAAGGIRAANADTTIIFPPNFFPADALHSSLNDGCLTADPAGFNGSQMLIEPCTYDATQAWNFNLIELDRGFVVATITSHATGQCMDADTGSLPFPGESVTDYSLRGTVVQLFQCNGAPQQKWILYTREADPASRHEATNAHDNADQMFTLIPYLALQPGWIVSRPGVPDGRFSIVPTLVPEGQADPRPGFGRTGPGTFLDHNDIPAIAIEHGTDNRGGGSQARSDHWDSPSLQCLFAFGVEHASASGRVVDGNEVISYSCPI